MTVPAASALKLLGQARHQDGFLSASRVLDTVKFTTLLDLLPSTDKPAVMPIDGSRQPITHARLRTMICDEINFSQFGLGRNDRVAILMPNGPELAVAFIAVLSYCTCAPLNPANTPQEIKGELENVNARAIVIMRGEDNAGMLAVAEELDLIVLIATVSTEVAGLFELSDGLAGMREASKLLTEEAHGPQRREDTAMVLHTSGSTGNKKVVPHTVEDLLAGALCIAAACQLQESDICCNQMPLFHIGGIARNVLSPILSGGSVVAMPYFEPALFWKVVSDKSATWYYAGPTMHMLILDAYKVPSPRHSPHAIRPNPRTPLSAPLPLLRTRRDPSRHGAATAEAEACARAVWQAMSARPRISLRFIANAAGPLLPSVAQDMRDTYSAANGSFCSIMPSYGMTECMPISSPPVGYNLDRPGTSGQIVGPQCAILDANGERLPFGEDHVGQICVKGHPVMHAYENNPEATAESFINGWFKTGDLGYMDEDGYLYVTGRSKEVINRGGEIISPTEIEEALLSHPAVKNLVAFSTPHDILQETIGVCVVTQPGHPRVGLVGLQAHAASSLHPSKWPYLIVYANDIPKTATGKAMRVRLDKRMTLPSINDDTPEHERLFEADMLPPGAPVQDPIPTAKLQIQLKDTEEALLRAADLLDTGKVAEAHACIRVFERKPQLVAYVTPETCETAALTAALIGFASLHEYLLPAAIVSLAKLPRSADGAVNEAELPMPQSAREYVAPASATESEVQELWIQVLGLEKAEDASVDEDFFLSGGSSLLAGTLAAEVKKRTGMPMSGTALFKHRTIAAIAEQVDAHRRIVQAKQALQPIGVTGLRSAKLEGRRSSVGFSAKVFLSGKLGADPVHPAAEGGFSSKAKPEEPFRAPCSSSGMVPLFVQSLPLLLNQPLRRILSWGMFVFLWLELLRPAASGGGAHLPRYPAMLIAIALTKILQSVFFPLAGIAIKWILIGRYRAGRARLWGSYYLRWWLVDQTLRFCGKGVFDISNGWRCMYYRFLGARIGVSVKLAPKCVITEPDLVSIGDNCAFDDSRIQPFCADGGEMMLSAIVIGSDCAVCTRTTVAPGASLPDGTCLPPLSSSYELEDARPEYRAFCRADFAGPPLVLAALVGYPIIAFVSVARLSLKLALIYAMVQGRQSSPVTWYEAIDWFLSTHRLLVYVAIRVASATVCPFLELAAVILAKRLVIGKFVAGPVTSGWSRFQYWLMRSLLPNGKLCGVAPLVGNHWGGVSFALRALGVTCGQRVFWPGSGLDVVEYDLLTIGDDVVFGSRSTFMCADANEAKPITLLAGANVADRCVLLPGVTLGVNGCFGSGSLAPKGGTYGASCVTVGSSGGEAALLDPGAADSGDAALAVTRKAFGRAFYGTKSPAAVRNGAAANTATWPVPPVWLYAMYVCGCHTFAAAYRAAQLIFAWLLLAAACGGRARTAAAFTGQQQPLWVATPHFNNTTTTFRESWAGFGPYLAALFGMYVAVHAVMVLGAFLLDISAKWAIMGRRQPGQYPWDTSSYCMRWNLYLSFAVIRKQLLNYIQGSEYLVMYFRALGANIGRNVCLYPTGSDPMMTEPDLVTIGNEACINHAFIVCHTNTKGAFSINWVVIGRRTTMRSWSRAMAGAVLEDESRLLEHTMALVGDMVDAGVIWQGWPVKTMHATEEYWGARRQLVKLGRKEVHRREKAMRPEHGSIKMKLVSMEAQMRRMQEENARVCAILEQFPSRSEQMNHPSSDSEQQSMAMITSLKERVEKLTRELAERDELLTVKGKRNATMVASSGHGHALEGYLSTRQSSLKVGADDHDSASYRSRREMEGAGVHLLGVSQDARV